MKVNILHNKFDCRFEKIIVLGNRNAKNLNFAFSHRPKTDVNILFGFLDNDGEQQKPKTKILNMDAFGLQIEKLKMVNLFNQ